MGLAVNFAPIGAIVSGFIGFIPNIISALVFLFFAYFGIKYLTGVSRRGFQKRYSEPVLVDFGTDIVFGFLWFGAALITMSLLGFDDIAASLGTATGFIALGVAFALKDMIADVVSGVRLIEDEDFNPGDRVKAADTEGKVADVDLRKTRIDLEDGDRVVISNAAVEKKWTKIN